MSGSSRNWTSAILGGGIASRSASSASRGRGGRGFGRGGGGTGGDARRREARSRSRRGDRRRAREARERAARAPVGRDRAFSRGRPGADRAAAVLAARRGEGTTALAGLARATSTVVAKTARLKTWDRLATEAGFIGRLTAAALEGVGGALIAGGYSSASLYACDALQRHRRDGGIVTGQMEEIIKDIKRAANKLPRGRRARGSLGPLPRLATGAWPIVVGGPAHARACGLTATWWLLRDVSLIDLDRTDVQLLEGAVALTFTCDKAAVPTATRIHSCVCGGDAPGAELDPACPACILADHVRSLDTMHHELKGVSYPLDAPLFPASEDANGSFPNLKRPTTTAMYAWVDGVAAAHGFDPFNADGTRRFGRHVWRRTGAAWMRRLIPREDLAALGNWSSAAIDAYLQEADPWDTADIAGLALGSRRPAAAVVDGAVVAGASDFEEGEFDAEVLSEDEIENLVSEEADEDEDWVSDEAKEPYLPDDSEVDPGIVEESKIFFSGEVPAKFECMPASSCGPPGGWAPRPAASGLGSRTCRFCISVQLGMEMFPASRCALCEGGPFHAACLYRGACVDCGPVHPGLRAAGSGALDAPWASGDLVRAATGGLVHKVLTASAKLPASRWKTICGWAFAEGGMRPGSSEAAVSCSKCSGRKRAAE